MLGGHCALPRGCHLLTTATFSTPIHNQFGCVCGGHRGGVRVRLETWSDITRFSTYPNGVSLPSSTRRHQHPLRTLSRYSGQRLPPRDLCPFGPLPSLSPFPVRPCWRGSADYLKCFRAPHEFLFKCWVFGKFSELGSKRIDPNARFLAFLVPIIRNFSLPSHDLFL